MYSTVTFDYHPYLHHRGENEEEDDEDLLGNYSGIGADDNDNAMDYLHEQDDIRFSCGSPIQRCFSNDLDIDGDSEMRDSLHDLPSSPAHRQRAKSPGKTNVDDSESDCYFSQQGNNDNEDEHIDFGNGNDDYYNDEFDNAAEDDNGGLGDNQMSQWNTFHNADAKFTDTQMEGCGGDEDYQTHHCNNHHYHFQNRYAHLHHHYYPAVRSNNHFHYHQHSFYPAIWHVDDEQVM